MDWFKKKKQEPIVTPKKNDEIKIEKIYLENTLDAQRTAMALLLTEYFYYLPLDDRIKIQMILSSVSAKDYTGMSVLEACHTLNYKELLDAQRLVEKEYKIIRH